MTFESISSVLRQIAQAWWAKLPASGWDECQLFWARLGGQNFCQMELATAGRLQTFTFPTELHPLLEELRQRMCAPTPGQGCWLSVSMKMTSTSTIEAFYNWGKRFYFNGLPTVFDPPAHESPFPSENLYLEELERSPRAVEYWPAWLAVDGAVVPDFLQPAPLPPALAWLEQAETFGWPSLVSEARACLVGNLRQSPHTSPALLGREGPARREQALQDLLYLSVACELKTLHRSSGEVTVKLWREWARRMNRPEPAGLLNLSLAAPLGELPPSAVLTSLVEDITSVLTALTAALIGAHFQTSPPRWNPAGRATN